MVQKSGKKFYILISFRFSNLHEQQTQVHALRESSDCSHTSVSLSEYKFLSYCKENRPIKSSFMVQCKRSSYQFPYIAFSFCSVTSHKFPLPESAHCHMQPIRPLFAYTMSLRNKAMSVHTYSTKKVPDLILHISAETISSWRSKNRMQEKCNT